MLISTVLVGLCACNLVAKSKAKLGGQSAPLSSAAAGPVAADAKDSAPVKNAVERLDALASFLEQKRWSDYARESSKLRAYFLFENGLEGEAKRDAIVHRLDALDAAAFKTFPRLHALVGSGARVVAGGVDNNVIEPITGVLEACRGSHDIRSRDALEKQEAAYVKSLDRVKKVDAKGFRYYGDTNSRFGTTDIPTALLACEGNLAEAASGFADEYVPETVPATQVEVGCGTADFLADGIRVGPNQFAPYTRTAGGASYPEKLDCKKLKKQSRYGAALADAVKDYATYIEIAPQDLVVVAEGKPYIEHAESDGEIHRFQKLVAYSRKFRFAKNPCGDAKVFCEAGGSKTAEAYNRLEHALERARVHAGANPSLCKAHLKDAKARAEWFAGFYAEAKQTGSWVAGATYKTKLGQQLREADVIAAFKDKAQLADDRLLGTYCDAPAKGQASTK